MSDEATAAVPADSPSPAPGTPATPATPAAPAAPSAGNEDHVGSADIPRNPFATEGNDPKQDAGDQGADGKADVAGAPEQYGDFTMPEGIVMNEQMMGQFLPLAKELGLTQDQAQQLVDLQTAEIAAQAQAQEDRWQTYNEEMVQAARDDREIGGTEEQFNEKVAIALQALEHFGTDELSEALTSTGAGNHPEFIRFCYRVGKAIANDRVIPGRQQGQSGEKSLAQTLFPSMQNP